MKLLFKNITTYNSKNYNQFIKFHGQRFNFSYNAYTLILAGFLFYCIILNVVQKNLFLILLFVSILILIFLFRMYLPVKRYEKTKKDFSQNKKTNITINFFKFHFKIKEKFYLYHKLYKVFETNDYFYLYVDKENAVLVSKNGFKLGTPEEFSKFIRKNCLFKYSKQT